MMTGFIDGILKLRLVVVMDTHKMLELQQDFNEKGTALVEAG